MSDNNPQLTPDDVQRLLEAPEVGDSDNIEITGVTGVPIEIVTKEDGSFTVTEANSWQYVPLGIFINGASHTEAETGSLIEEGDFLVTFGQVKYIKFDFDFMKRMLAEAFADESAAEIVDAVVAEAEEQQAA